ncbi:MAG: DUF2341 domain-containing protein, partial [Kiritimatiellae bacterium]|nr:DUF2341 domain-containing protein [Kiritimatiellia bacterium]
MKDEDRELWIADRAGRGHAARHVRRRRDVASRGWRVVLCVAGSLLCLLPAAEAAWKSGYGYRKSLTIDADAVSGTDDLTNFPALVSLTDADLATTNNGGHVTSADGYDILFTGQDGTTQLDHELERYTQASGELVAWVRVPILSGATDTALYLYFGNGSIGSTQERVEDVWTNDFRGVWHLAETSGTVCYDSTAWTNHGVKTAESNPASTNAGMIGGAQLFDNSVNRIDIGDPASGALDMDTGSFTYGCWVYADASSGTFDEPWSKGGGSVSNPGFDLEFGTGGWNSYLSDGDETKATQFTQETLGQWLYAVAVVDRAANLARVYVNGSESNTLDITSLGSVSGTAAGSIGASPTGNYPFQGRIDEMRVAAALRTADWIATCYTNQFDPAGFLAAGSKEAAAASWNSGWNYRKKLTIDGDRVSGTANLVDFPALVSLTDADLATTAHGGKLANANGYDLIFTAADGTNTLDHEIERHVLTSGELIAWVRVPVLDCDDDTVVYVYFGNSSISSSQENAAEVWDASYLAVWHLEQEPTGAAGEIADSTANGIDATASGPMTAAGLKPGWIGYGQEFDGSSDFIRSATDATTNVLNRATNAVTLESWAWLDADPGGIIDTIVHRAKGPGWDDAWYLAGATGPVWRLRVDWYSGAPAACSESGVINTGAWYHVAGTWDGVTERVYVDGVEADSQARDLVLPPDDNCVYIGAHTDDHDSNTVAQLNGRIDEVRVSDIARSADWIATSYTNQFDPAGFLTASAAQTPAWKSGYSYRKALTIDADKVSGTTNLVNFPALVSLTDSDLATAANGGKLANANGYDLIFTAADG